MASKVGIIAYGTEEDRRMLEVLAMLDKKSSSAWIVETIRSQFREIYGETKPKDVLDARGKQRRTPR